MMEICRVAPVNFLMVILFVMLAVFGLINDGKRSAQKSEMKLCKMHGSLSSHITMACSSSYFILVSSKYDTC